MPSDSRKSPDKYSLQTIGNGLAIDRGAIYNAMLTNCVSKGKKGLEFVTTQKAGLCKEDFHLYRWELHNRP
jgi:hypothetical protein